MRYALCNRALFADIVNAASWVSRKIRHPSVSDGIVALGAGVFCSELCFFGFIPNGESVVIADTTQNVSLF